MMLVFTSCRKKGCTSYSAENYNSEAKKDDGSCIFEEPSNSFLCDGLSVNQYIPFGLNNKWTYNNIVSGTVSGGYYEEITGVVNISNIDYYVIAKAGNPAAYHLRLDSNGDLIKLSGSTESLFMAQFPQVGDVYVEGTVSSVNAGFVTQDCSYNGCVELLNSAGTKKYFKKGLGYVGSLATNGNGSQLSSARL